MSTTFKDARRLQGERVRMQFDDDREVLGRLLCATKDIDGSRHLIYRAGPGSDAENTLPNSPCVYADARTLMKIEPADSENSSRSTRISNPLLRRRQPEKASPNLLRNSA